MKRVLLVTDAEVRQLRNDILDPSLLRPTLRQLADGQATVEDTLVSIQRRIDYLMKSWMGGE